MPLRNVEAFNSAGITHNLKGDGQMRNITSFGPIANQADQISADGVVHSRDVLLRGGRAFAKTCLNGAAALCATVLVAVVAAAPVLADTLADIKKAGVVRFGVKADVKPWAYVDSSGKPIGFEIDLAGELAERMGVKLEFITVTSANRIQYLEQGNVHIVLATMSDTPKRREVVRMIEPHYFGDASNLLAPAGSKFKTWPDIKGAVLCAVNGAIYNKWVAQEYNAEVKAFKGPPEAIAALKQNQCEGFVFSDQILRIMQETEEGLKDYVVALDPVNTDYWAIAVNLDSKDDSLANALSDSIAAMHKSGKMLELAKGHGLGGNPFLKFHASQ
jgi:polar amino acid transport system substrate-binding protein